MVDRLMIEDVRRSALGPSPLDVLASAAARSAQLSAEADALIDHFVAEARRGGCSWTEIGGRLGVTKQAVRERFGDRVHLAGRERFTPRLQRCVSAAGEIAHHHGAAEVSPVHMLVALASNDGIALGVLERLGVPAEVLMPFARPLLGDGPPGSERPDESPELIEALRSAGLLALQGGRDYVGTEHVLFVLASDLGGRVRRILDDLGVSLADIKRELAPCVEMKARRRRQRRRTESVCSFCGAAGGNRLVRGPGVWICRACARVAADATEVG